MLVRSCCALALALLCETASSASVRHRWKTYQADPDYKVSVCYPADLLRIRPDQDDGTLTSLVGKDAYVLINARPDKYTDLKSELQYSLAENLGGPRWIHETGPDPTPVHYVVIPRMKVTSSIVNDRFYLYVAENRKDVVVDWAVHVDDAIKSMEIRYPKARASAWKNVPERMRSCFKSLGPITNPNIQ